MIAVDMELDIDIGPDIYPGPSARIVTRDNSILVRPPFYELDTAVCLIGRLPDCQIVIEHKFVSKLHAKIEFRDTDYFLTDLDSKNGTFINGERIWEPHILMHEDMIGLGSGEPLLRFEYPEKFQNCLS